MKKKVIMLVCTLLFAGFLKKFASLLYISITFVNMKNSLCFFLLGMTTLTMAWIIMKKRLRFLLTDLHEHLHLLFLYLSGYSPRELYVSEKGGHVQGTGSNLPVMLAPYFFPLLVFVWVLLFPFVRFSYNYLFFFILGLLTSFHFLAALDDYFSQIKIKNSDINRLGILSASCFIIFADLLIYGSVLAFVIGGFHGIKTFLLEGIRESIGICKIIMRMAMA